MAPTELWPGNASSPEGSPPIRRWRHDRMRCKMSHAWCKMSHMGLMAWIVWGGLVSCAPPRPPLALRTCMETMLVTNAVQPAPAEVLMQSSASCRYRESCLDALRKRACEVGGYRVVLSDGSVGSDVPYALHAAPASAYAARPARYVAPGTTTGIPSAGTGSGTVVHAWITRKPSGDGDASRLRH